MNILTIGTGYVGTTTGLAFAEFGHRVLGLDIDQAKIESLQKGTLFFYEPGLEELLQKHLHKGTVQFTTDMQEAVQRSEVIFICVGTPSGADGSANLMYVEQAAKAIGKYMNGYKIIVNKSTVPVGTADKVQCWVAEGQGEDNQHAYDVLSNPEFLREGSAVRDALNPDRVVIGGYNLQATATVGELYKHVSTRVIMTTPPVAELIKYASNSFLALKISYINELARLCDRLAINIQEVALGVGLDKRIGPSFLQAGIGYGGSCFPKDVSALIHTSTKAGLPLTLLEKVTQINQSQPLYFIEKIKETLGSLTGKKLAVLGLAFKPGTDDTRESPAFIIIEHLIRAGATIHVHDPVVQLAGQLPPEDKQHIQQYAAPELAVTDVNGIIICTDWPLYRELDWAAIRQKVAQHYLFDGRNMLNEQKMKELGFTYQGVGNA